MALSLIHLLGEKQGYQVGLAFLRPASKDLLVRFRLFFGQDFEQVAVQHMQPAA